MCINSETTFKSVRVIYLQKYLDSTVKKREFVGSTREVVK